MTLPEISLIEEERRKQKLSQNQLAKKAGVSQSLIARVEAGSVDPRYSKVKAIFAALEGKKEKEIIAKQIMTKKVLGVEYWETVEKTAMKLKRYNVSQMPVFDGNQIIGSISERGILDAIGKGTSSKDLSKREVKEIIEPEFPSINIDTPVSVISSLLEHHSAIVVKEKGNTAGIITNSNILNMVTNKK